MLGYPISQALFVARRNKRTKVISVGHKDDEMPPWSLFPSTVRPAASSSCIPKSVIVNFLHQTNGWCTPLACWNLKINLPPHAFFQNLYHFDYIQELREKFLAEKNEKVSADWQKWQQQQQLFLVLKYPGNTKKRLYPDDLQQPAKLSSFFLRIPRSLSFSLFLCLSVPCLYPSPPGNFVILTLHYCFM